MDLGVIGTLTGYTLAGLGTGITAFFVMRRRMSRDGVELTKDRAEINIVDILTKQRDDAIAEKEIVKNDLNTLSTRREEMREEIEKLKKEVERLQGQLRISQKLCEKLSLTLDEAKKQLTELVKTKKKGAE